MVLKKAWQRFHHDGESKRSRQEITGQSTSRDASRTLMQKSARPTRGAAPLKTSVEKNRKKKFIWIHLANQTVDIIHFHNLLFPRGRLIAVLVASTLACPSILWIFFETTLFARKSDTLLSHFSHPPSSLTIWNVLRRQVVGKLWRQSRTNRYLRMYLQSRQWRRLSRCAWRVTSRCASYLDVLWCRRRKLCWLRKKENVNRLSFFSSLASMLFKMFLLTMNNFVYLSRELHECSWQKFPSFERLFWCLFLAHTATIATMRFNQRPVSRRRYFKHSRWINIVHNSNDSEPHLFFFSGL